MVVSAQVDDPRQKHYQRNVRPILMEHCYPCHNGEDKKAGIDFDNYFFISSIVRNGELFTKIIEQVENRTMPPEMRPRLTQMEVDTVAHYLDSYLQAALAEKDPGLIPPRRLSNQEYKYVVQDLLNLKVDVDSLFPSDPSGGAGFDNHAAVLYMSPLLIERYFETADGLLEQLYADPTAWRNLVPKYRPSIWTSLRNLWYRVFYDQDVSMERPLNKASETLIPFATLAYRGFIGLEDKASLLKFFEQTYIKLADRQDRYDASIKETMKLIMMSHNFLYRIEGDPEVEVPYEISNIELASRLSFFLWSSIPDQELLNAAYREDLHDSLVLEREVNRMLQSPKAKRFGEQFALQWLELKKLRDPAFQVDPEIFPEYNTALSESMLKEVELFFNHVLLESNNLLELIDSDYSFLNEQLADHYDIQGIEGPDMRMVSFASHQRGGILGMAGVLTATSLPNRTSPVLRGKWVLEQVLGTPPPPPPPDVPELEVSHDSSESVETLRVVLERHREDPSCSGCHQAMDPIGLGLENFDAIGRWRTAYGKLPIDPSGIMDTGETFEGPADLRKVLVGKRALFAKNFSEKMLSFALGRSLEFKDSPTVKQLQELLLTSDFNSKKFILEIAKSYPFRYKKSDNKDVPTKRLAG
ncbi:MAG: hypothetical protein DHS20C17_19610 [Cyclobacteriaceae bacterium]|nr:MAG: hypothetical protein DHS20C17_19610 [Cyclobacteriaceae bacterium]